MCSTEPGWSPGIASQKQPPACGIRERFFASPDQVCSDCHQVAGEISASHTSLGLAVTTTSLRETKPPSPLSVTSAATGIADLEVAINSLDAEVTAAGDISLYELDGVLEKLRTRQG